MVYPVDVLFFLGFKRIKFVGKLELNIAEFFHHSFLFSFGLLDQFFVLVSIVFFIFLEFLSESGFDFIQMVMVFVVG